jgi:hypothetical protein
MSVAARRASPLAKGRLPFAQPRSHGWQESRAVALALVAGPPATVVAVRAAVAAKRSRRGPVDAAVHGYKQAPVNERAAGNMLSSFLLTLGAARGVNYVLEQRVSKGGGIRGGGRGRDQVARVDLRARPPLVDRQLPGAEPPPSDQRRPRPVCLRPLRLRATQPAHGPGGEQQAEPHRHGEGQEHPFGRPGDQ